MEKSSRSDFQEEDLIAINQIIIRCAVKFQNAIYESSDPKKYASKMATQLKSGKTLCSIFLFSRLLNLNPADLYSPLELKTMILHDMKPDIAENMKETITVDDMTGGILSNRYVSDSTLSKVYNEFLTNGWLVPLNKKDQLKNFRALHAKNHKKTYNTKGRISFYTISPEAEMTKKLLGNPKAVEIINSSLKKSGLLHKYLKAMMQASMYLLIVANQEETDLLKQAVVALFAGVYPSLRLDAKDWESFKETLSLQDENLLEKVAEMLVPLIEEKLGFPYIIYGLSMLEDE